jgi:hypothetical protein
VDDETMKAAIEAQFLMGHYAPAQHMAMDRTTIVAWSWDVDTVRQQLHVPCNDTWEQRVFDLEVHGLASFSFYAAPVTYDEEGTAHELPGWQDEPRERWGSVGIHPAGVLRLAEIYQRPYVRREESPALLAHWQLVQQESEARLRAQPWQDEAQWAREWPERAFLRKAREAGIQGDEDARRE